MSEETTVTTEAPVPAEPQGEDEFKKRLTGVQDSLREIEAGVKRDADSLQRLRSMLDLSYLEDLTNVIHDLEIRVSELGDEADRARRRAADAESKLREEQDRLEKLWDVYKSQETELESTKGQLRDAKRQVSQANDKAEELGEEVEAGKRALRQAQSENGELRDKLAEAEARTEELRAFEALDGKVKDLEGELEEERERLAKLYAVFEETQAERDDLSARSEQWTTWFDAHGEALRAVSKAVNEAPSGE